MKTISLAPFAPSPRRQAGAALITGLIFLVVLTMIGITSARMSSLEERMSGNMRDRAYAMQAAEAALRDAERDIMGLSNPPIDDPAKVKRSDPISGITGFSATCDATGDRKDDGLCDRQATEPSSYTLTSITWPLFTAGGTNYAALTVDMTAAPSIPYGTYTGAPDIVGLSAQPRYIIEGVEKYCWQECEASPTAGYRITVRAQGINDNTVVWLQEVFKPI